MIAMLHNNIKRSVNKVEHHFSLEETDLERLRRFPNIKTLVSGRAELSTTQNPWRHSRL